MRNFLKKSIIFMFLFLPEIVFASDFLVCGNERKFPLIFATIVSILYTAVKIIVPIFLVIFGMLSFVKAVFAGDSADEMNKSKKKFITSIIVAVIIFFLIPIVKFPIALVGGINNDFSSCLDCLVKPNNCEHVDSDIKQLCPGLISEQKNYDDNCNYTGGIKVKVDYGTGDTGIIESSVGKGPAVAIQTGGEWATWKQKGESWSNLKIGSSSKTIGEVGCLITSMSIQIARSGTKINADSFDPGVFMKHAKFNGASLIWNSWSSIAPNFKLVNDLKISGTNLQKAQKVQSYIDQGCYVIVAVRNSGHFVAVDRVEGDKIYMFNPGSNTYEIFSTYDPKGVNRILVLKDEG